MGVKLGNGNWAVKEDKLLAYNDKSGKFFNKEFDFTRGSSATYVAKDGLIKTAGIQPNSVLNGDFSQEGAELVTNGGFDTDSDWFKGGSATISGGYLNLTASGDFAQQSITNPSHYVVRINVSSVTTSGDLRIRSNNFAETFTFSVTSAQVYTFYSPISADGFVVQSNGFIGSIDNVSVVEVGQNWNITQGTVGDNKASFSTTDGSFAAIQQNNILTVGKRYKYSFEILSITGEISSNLNTGGNIDYTTTGVKNGEMTASVSGLEIKRKFGINNTSTEITNISVQEIQVDTPRIDFSDSSKGALLLEPSGSNLLPYSSDFSKSAWNKQDISVGSKVLSPSGSNDAYEMIENTGYYHHRFTDGTAVVAGEVYTISIFAKKNTRSFFNITMHSGPFGNNAYANYNLNNGTVHYTASSATSKIEDYGNGWYRCFITVTANINYGNAAVEITLSNQATNTRVPHYQGDDVSGMYFWGCQYEQKSFATSYIPTYGTTATRLGETCTNSGSEQDFNGEEGVLYAEMARGGENNSYELISMNKDNSIDEFLCGFGKDSGNKNLMVGVKINGNWVFQNVDTGIEFTKEFSKIAVRYKSGDTCVYLNGANILSSSTVFSSVVTPNKLGFKWTDAIANHFRGKVRNLRVYTEALTDAELQELTS